MDIAGLGSSDWRVRARSLGEILLEKDALQNKDVQDALINCQRRENDLMAVGNVPDDERYGDN